jgi:hypothetical protein
MANEFLGAAKKSKSDEFYTQFADIEREMGSYVDYDANAFRDKVVLLPCDDPEWSNFTKYFAQNFERLGLKKIISTSYAPNSKPNETFLNPTLFELEDPQYDEIKAVDNGKIFILDRDINGDEKIDVEDLHWNYLDGDGDFRSAEIANLRDEADIIVTNPPFSLFREFLTWIIESDKKFIIVGNQNAITYKEVFPLIKENKIWLGKGFTRNMAHFYTPYVPESKWIEQEGENIVRVAGIQWFTNLEHGRRHELLALMTKDDNFKFSKHKEVRGVGYRAFDNFDAIEVPFTDAIPSDYEGVMGVPITFMNKYNPAQFEILGCTYDYGRPTDWPSNVNMAPIVNGVNIYKRILIRHRNGTS